MQNFYLGLLVDLHTTNLNVFFAFHTVHSQDIGCIDFLHVHNILSALKVMRATTVWGVKTKEDIVV